METNFQLLMLSSNLLKSKIPTFRWGGGLVETNFQLLMLSSNLLKSQIPMFRWGRVSGNQFPKVNFKFSKSSPELKFSFWGGGLVETNFQLLMLSPNLLKSKKIYKGFWWKFSKFSGKKVPGNGFGLWVPSGSRIRSIREPQKESSLNYKKVDLLKRKGR